MYCNLLKSTLSFDIAITLDTGNYQDFAHSKSVIASHFAFKFAIRKEKNLPPKGFELRLRYGSLRCTKCWSTKIFLVSYLK